MITGSEHGYVDPFVITSTGGRFYLDHPILDLKDIAHALSLNCRFTGHINYMYSVAQHSLMVSEIAEFLAGMDGMDAQGLNMVAYDGLLHDMSEAYLCDVASPFKQRLGEWNKVDKTLDAALREQAGLPVNKSDYVKKADWYALFIEASLLLPKGGVEAFEDPHGFKEQALGLYVQCGADWNSAIEEAIPHIDSNTFYQKAIDLQRRLAA